MMSNPINNNESYLSHTDESQLISNIELYRENDPDSDRNLPQSTNNEEIRQLFLIMSHYYSSIIMTY